MFKNNACSAEEPLTVWPPVIGPRTRMPRPKQLKHVHGHEDRPTKRTDHDKCTGPVWHRSPRNNQPPMAGYTRRYDAVPLGMGVCIRQPRVVERVFDWGDLYSGVVRTGRDRGRAAIWDGFEGAVRCSGRRGRVLRCIASALCKSDHQCGVVE